VFIRPNIRVAYFEGSALSRKLLIELEKLQSLQPELQINMYDVSRKQDQRILREATKHGHSELAGESSKILGVPYYVVYDCRKKMEMGFTNLRSAEELSDIVTEAYQLDKEKNTVEQYVEDKYFALENWMYTTLEKAKKQAQTIPVFGALFGQPGT
jgi:hypothetical protein